jgi:hypothetical protein
LHFDLCQQTSKRKRFYIQPFKELLIKRDLFKDDCFLALAYDKDHNLCSGKYYLAHKDIVTYLTGGTSELGTKNKVGYDLLWKSILYFKELGFKTFDLEVAMINASQNLQRIGVDSLTLRENSGVDIVFPRPYIKYVIRDLRCFKKLQLYLYSITFGRMDISPCNCTIHSACRFLNQTYLF